MNNDTNIYGKKFSYEGYPRAEAIEGGLQRGQPKKPYEAEHEVTMRNDSWSKVVGYSSDISGLIYDTSDIYPSAHAR